ncbi:hypothetical protein C7451_110119 [Blastomonas natatoria]|uniref:Uncharacterized protein n=1 Tax=Blastomonas natatoria TaxID=34015 RepID=A0A2V3UVN7_9SPHN|nr:hypothetical protein [Blastomonas natatoria]PXW73392.1 hypothetical protein C7451_110119 [Blastomonas natatoria]
MNALRRPGGLPALCALVIAIAMVNAPLARAQGRVLVMENCNGGTTTILIPEKDDGLPRKQSDCAKACHAMTDRRGKSTGKKAGPHC